MRRYPNEELIQVHPLDGLIYCMPFKVQMWFTQEVQDVSVSVLYDGGTVDNETIKQYEYQEPKYWKNHENEIGYAESQKNKFYIVEWLYQLQTRQMVQFTVTYKTLIDDVLTERTHIMDFTTFETTIPETSEQSEPYDGGINL